MTPAENPPPSHFWRLVLGCIDASDSESRRIFSDFSRSTRFSHLRTATKSKFADFFNFLHNFNDFLRVLHHFAKL